MPKENIHQCFRFLYLMAFCGGCLGFRQRNDGFHLKTWHGVYTKLMRIFLAAGFIGGFAVKINDEESNRAMFSHMAPIVKFIVIFECVNCLLTYVSVSVMMELKKRSHIVYADRLQTLDESLQKAFPCINWNYPKSLRKYSSLTIILAVFFYLMSMVYFFNLANCRCNVWSTLLIASIYASMSMAIGSVNFLHVAGIDMIRLRFRLLQRLLEQLDSQPDAQERLRQIAKYCKSYTELVIDLNQVFGYVCAVGIFHDFGLLTNLGYLAVRKASESQSTDGEYIGIILYMIPCSYKVAITACYGLMTDMEKKRCIHTVSRMWKEGSHPNQESHQWFLHWKMHNNYNLTVGNMIPCNLSLALMVLHGIANYIIILIQLQFQQNNLNQDIPKDVELISRH